MDMRLDFDHFSSYLPRGGDMYPPERQLVNLPQVLNTVNLYPVILELYCSKEYSSREVGRII